MNLTILPEEMKRLEEAYMADTHVPGALLMEHAAQGVCDALSRVIPGRRALILCGPGNNGGDGYAAARLWQARGGISHVLELTDRVQGDAAMNRTLALQAGVPVTLAADAPDALPACDAIVDALFGTGLSRDTDGAAAALIRLVNASGKSVVAVDIPSGIRGCDGKRLGEAIRADETVTFHRMKPGLLLRDGVNCAGRITVHPILIPLAFGPQDGLRCLEPEDLPRLIPPRPRDSHKGTFGRVVLMAGSPGMAGAAAFCANACIRSGAGLTRVLCREGILPVVQTLAPGAVCVPLPEKDGRLVPGAEKIAARELTQADAAAAGCGLGQADDVIPALTAFAAAPCPVVWDADALNLLSAGALPPPGPHAVLTPHPGEAARLLACAPCAIAEDPLAAAHRLQGRYGCTVLLKGARTLMTDGTLDAVNRHGTPAMAKGGSGDVLTGILAALLARRLPCTTLETVQAAALIHGLAGLRAEAQSGENGVTPQQLVEQIRV